MREWLLPFPIRMRQLGVADVSGTFQRPTGGASMRMRASIKSRLPRLRASMKNGRRFDDS